MQIGQNEMDKIHIDFSASNSVGFLRAEISDVVLYLKPISVQDV